MDQQSTNMAAPQQFNLRWNNYLSNLQDLFLQHLQQESYVDVTISCQGKFIKAHKMVLSACSPYFQEMFRIHAVQHPIVIINGLSFDDVKQVIDFMYSGEVKVLETELNSLLAAAELLQIKGLSKVKFNSEKGQSQLPQTQQQPQQTQQEPQQTQQEPQSQQEIQQTQQKPQQIQQKPQQTQQKPEQTQQKPQEIQQKPQQTQQQSPQPRQQLSQPQQQPPKPQQQPPQPQQQPPQLQQQPPQLQQPAQLQPQPEKASDKESGTGSSSSSETKDEPAENTRLKKKRKMTHTINDLSDPPKKPELQQRGTPSPQPPKVKSPAQTSQPPVLEPQVPRPKQEDADVTVKCEPPDLKDAGEETLANVATTVTRPPVLHKEELEQEEPEAPKKPKCHIARILKRYPKKKTDPKSVTQLPTVSATTASTTAATATTSATAATTEAASKTPTVAASSSLSSPAAPTPIRMTMTTTPIIANFSDIFDQSFASKIPRPPNAFMIFANEWRKKLSCEFPKESNKEISVRLGMMWKHMNPNTKDHYYQASRKADEDHKRKYPGYYYSPKEARIRKNLKTIDLQNRRKEPYDAMRLVKLIMTEQKDGCDITYKDITPEERDHIGDLHLIDDDDLDREIFLETMVCPQICLNPEIDCECNTVGAAESQRNFS